MFLFSSGTSELIRIDGKINKTKLKKILKQNQRSEKSDDWSGGI